MTGKELQDLRTALAHNPHEAFKGRVVAELLDLIARLDRDNVDLGWQLSEAKAELADRASLDAAAEWKKIREEWEFIHAEKQSALTSHEAFLARCAEAETDPNTITFDCDSNEDGVDY